MKKNKYRNPEIAYPLVTSFWNHTMKQRLHWCTSEIVVSLCVLVGNRRWKHEIIIFLFSFTVSA